MSWTHCGGCPHSRHQDGPCNVPVEGKACGCTYVKPPSPPPPPPPRYPPPLDGFLPNQIKDLQGDILSLGDRVKKVTERIESDLYTAIGTHVAALNKRIDALMERVERCEEGRTKIVTKKTIIVHK